MARGFAPLGGFARLQGPRIALGQEPVRAPGVPPAPDEDPSPPPRTPLETRRKAAHDKLVRVRQYAHGVLRNVEALAWFLGEDEARKMVDEATLAIERSEEGYLAAEGALALARRAAESPRG